MFIEPAKGASGFFDVDWSNNFVHWLAWREWQHEAFGKNFFQQHLTVMFAWPPTSGHGASACADWLRQIREEIGKDDRKHGGGSCAAVPEVVSPWREWDQSLKRDVAAGEAERRQNWGGLFNQAPNYPWRARYGWRYAYPAVERRSMAEVLAGIHGLRAAE